MSQQFKIKDTVYVYDRRCKLAIEGIVDNIFSDAIAVSCRRFIGRDGNPCGEAHGSYMRNPNEIWETADKVYNEIDSRDNALFQEYIEKIGTIRDLLEFPLKHCLCDNEHADPQAVKAYKAKADSLMGMKID